MKIVVLVDNVTQGIGQRKKSSISFYIEAQNHKILFDLGSNDLFLANASKLSIDISNVDTVVLSSGFSDLGGGLKNFLSKNEKASIYLQQNAFEPYYISRLGVKRYCGLDENLKDNPRLNFTNNLYFLDDNIQLLSNITERRYRLENSGKYFVKKEDGYEPDNFLHEQYMTIEEDDKCVLFAGCPNNDISSIIRKAEGICNRQMDYVFTGFHLLDAVAKKDVNAEQINEFVKELQAKRTKYYTSTFSGKDANEMLAGELGEQLEQFVQGEVINI